MLNLWNNGSRVEKYDNVDKVINDIDKNYVVDRTSSDYSFFQMCLAKIRRYFFEENAKGFNISGMIE